MYSTQLINNAVATAHNIAQVDAIARVTWQQWAAGNLSDADAEALSSAAESRKRSIRAFVTAPSEHPPATARRRPIRTQGRQRSIFRRRRLATSGVLPASLAGSFTQGETSVLSVVGRECRKNRNNRCELTIDAIAALAGVCRSLAQRALHEADRLDIISLTERRRPSQRSLPNVVTIISSQWRTWLKLGGEGLKKETPRITRSYPATRTPERTHKAAAEHLRTTNRGRAPSINLKARQTRSHDSGLAHSQLSK